MVSRDYWKEVDLSPVDRKVAWPLAVVICTACIASAVWCAVKFAPDSVSADSETPAKTVANR